jgi:hypothetical protein
MWQVLFFEAEKRRGRFAITRTIHPVRGYGAEGCGQRAVGRG